MPGGYGTLDEFCEILTWAQLGIHAKPCGVLNVTGYYDALLSLFDHAVEEGLLRPHRDMFVVDADATELLRRLEDVRFVPTSKWDSADAPKQLIVYG
jgi:uncharacterized protein (TIGR00730 family)